MKPNKYPLSRKENIVVQELDGEVLIYDLSENKAFCLNETSALVWEMCDGNKSISEISEGLGKKLNSKASEDLVWLALDQLKKEKLIANSEEIAHDFNGMSRRDVIKKVGLGTMIALPIVTGLIAPTAAHAQSLGACRSTCACSVTNQTPTTQNCTSLQAGATVTSGCGAPGAIPAGCTCQVPGTATPGAGTNTGNCTLAAPTPAPPVCGNQCACSVTNQTATTQNCANLQAGATSTGCQTGCTCQVPGTATPGTGTNTGTCTA